jgi:hypothetical protein
MVGLLVLIWTYIGGHALSVMLLGITLVLLVNIMRTGRLVTLKVLGVDMSERAGWLMALSLNARDMRNNIDNMLFTCNGITVKVDDKVKKAKLLLIEVERLLDDAKDEERIAERKKFSGS